MTATTTNMPSIVSLSELKHHLCIREHLSKEECENALLPTLEHASMVHSHLHHPTSDRSLHSDPFDQTRNAIVYISLVVVVYVVVVMWLVTTNFRANLSATASNVLRGQFIDGEDSEGEALLVVRDHGNGQTSCSTLMLYDEEKEGVEPV